MIYQDYMYKYTYIYIYIYSDLYPIGSMYAIYGNIYHQYTPNVSIYNAYIPAPWILWVYIYIP